MKTMFSPAKAIPLVAFSMALLLVGCLDIVKSSGNANPNPSAWKPDVAGIEFSASERPLQANDQVDVIIQTIGNSTPAVKDIVDSFGNITLPFIGEFRVAQLTIPEAERAIKNEYVEKGFFTASAINIQIICPTIAEETTRMYSVTGNVGKRGFFPYRDGLTLREAIINAGDLDRFASGTVTITRNGVVTSYDLDKIKKGRIEDPVIRPRDIIEAKESRF